MEKNIRSSYESGSSKEHISRVIDVKSPFEKKKEKQYKIQT